MSNRGASAVKAKGGESEPLNQVPVLDVSNITPEQFWAEYVAPRKPVLIRGHPTDLSWRATGLWTDDYLVARAGSAQVLVEVRGGPGEGYGRGLKRRMAFGDLVRRLAAGDTHLYLTAQQVPVAPDGHPALMAEPLLSLAAAGDFPAAPALAGHLVPQSVNLWMGAAPEGSSSGLHHDFHDNLYLLLRGAKRFRLYPPAAAPRMYTVGRLVRAYDNGRIVYEGQGDIAPDGTSASEVAHWRRRRAAEAAMAEAEAAVQRGDKGAGDALAAAEAALEAALDAELQEALGGGGGGDSEDWEDMRDDFEEEEEDEDSEEQQERGQTQQKQAGKGAGGSKGKAGDGKGAEGEGEGEGGLILEPDSATPPSFCRVPIGDPGVSDAHIAAQWPRFPGRAAALEARVEAGCMLYLPAGWFHEVTSYGAAGPASATTNGNPGAGYSAGSSTGGGHLAFNYWFHPPDRLDPGRTTGFNRPYTSDYWPALWRARCAAGLPGGMEPGLGAQPPPAAEGPGTDPTDPAHPHHAWRKDAAAGPPVPVHHGQEEDEEEGEEGEEEDEEGEEDEDEDEEMADGEEDADLSPPRRQHQGQGQSPQGGSGPPRSRVQAVRDLLEAIAAARAAGAADGAAAAAAGGGGGGGGGGAAAEEGLPAGMTEEDYQVLLQLDQAQRRGQAMQAMRAFFERQMKLRELQRLRSRLPPGRRHHPVIRVARAVRRWRPAQPLGRKGAAAAAAEAEAAGGAGGAGGGGAQAAVGVQQKGKKAGAAGGVRVAGGVRKVGRR